MSKEAKILIAIAVVVLAGGIFLFLKGNPQPVEPGQPVDSKSLMRDTSHMTGKASAKVNIVEFGDYQCPACAAAEPVVEKIRQSYKDNADVNFVFRNFPLTQHDKAQISAEAAEAAAAQGKFWEMHDTLYQHQNDWAASPDPLSIFAGYAQALGLNVDQFKLAVQQNQFRSVIQADIDDGTSLSVDSTPTFFINGERYVGVPTEADFKQKVDAALAK